MSLLKNAGLEVNRENYLNLAYLGEVPDPLPAEAEVELEEAGIA